MQINNRLFFSADRGRLPERSKAAQGKQRSESSTSTDSRSGQAPKNNSSLVQELLDTLLKQTKSQGTIKEIINSTIQSLRNRTPGSTENNQGQTAQFVSRADIRRILNRRPQPASIQIDKAKGSHRKRSITILKTKKHVSHKEESALTSREGELLIYAQNHPGTVVSREHISGIHRTVYPGILVSLCNKLDALGCQAWYKKVEAESGGFGGSGTPAGIIWYGPPS
jgi:hypothetical protein